MADKKTKNGLCGKKVQILIPIDQLNPDILYEDIIYNLVLYRVKRGEYVEVPVEVAQVLKESQSVVYEMNELENEKSAKNVDSKEK